MAKNLEVKKENTNARNPSIVDPFLEMDRMMDRFFNNPFSSWLPEISASLPRRAMSNIKETDQCWLMTAELPGVPKDDIQINVNGNILNVKAEHKHEEDKDNEYRREYRSFNQSFVLPSTVDPDKIEAHYENGLLEVMLPKVEQAQSKQIEVQTGKGGFFSRLLGNKKSEADSQKNSNAKH